MKYYLKDILLILILLLQCFLVYENHTNKKSIEVIKNEFLDKKSLEEIKTEIVDEILQNNVDRIKLKKI